MDASDRVTMVTGVGPLLLTQGEHKVYTIYSLVPGVSFDLFDSLYKPDAPKTTTVHVSDTALICCTALQQGGACG